MIIDPIPLCSLLHSICVEHSSNLTVLADARPMPAFVTKPNFTYLISASFDLSQDSLSNLSQIQREARMISDWFNEASHYKIKFKTAERLLVKMKEWTHILQVRFEIYEHDSEHKLATFKPTWT